MTTYSDTILSVTTSGLTTFGMTLIAFICRGNTCRSPLAEALARRSFADVARPVTVASAGVAVDRPGAPADPRAVAAGARYGLDLTSHRAAALTVDLVASADFLIALDQRTQSEILARYGTDTCRVPLLMSFQPNAGGPDVADPYYGTDEDYARALNLISAGIDGLVRSLR
ncbi:MAG TPA: low molecular weight protein-tyrosine-phosphatase [Hyphomicrobiaceae bacterium]|nr:low molecular weight protein-tyrosine-phosphatase [Hyphomicrobiaceae bacterium]